MNLHEIEEMDFGRNGGLWDASPDVCCAYFQTGACAHTENFDPDEAVGDEDQTWGEVYAAWDPEVDGQGNAGLAAALDRLTATDDEPF